MDEVMTWKSPDGESEFCCSHCKAPWVRRWVYCPHCTPEKYDDFERRRA